MRTGEIWLAQLDPTLGSEIQKTRPCVVVSPDEMNAHLDAGVSRIALLEDYLGLRWPTEHVATGQIQVRPPGTPQEHVVQSARHDHERRVLLRTVVGGGALFEIDEQRLVNSKQA